MRPDPELRDPGRWLLGVVSLKHSTEDQLLSFFCLLARASAHTNLNRVTKRVTPGRASSPFLPASLPTSPSLSEVQVIALALPASQGR